jgi:hypothetical protein
MIIVDYIPIIEFLQLLHNSIDIIYHYSRYWLYYNDNYNGNDYIIMIIITNRWLVLTIIIDDNGI